MLKSLENKYKTVFLDLIDPLFDAVNPENLVLGELEKYDFSLYENIYVLGVGKAVVAMVRAVEKQVGNISGGHIVYPNNQSVPDFANIGVSAGSHPLPDAGGMAGAEKILDYAFRAGENDLVICLISGGGSALLPLPLEGLSLDEKKKISEGLIKSGASINEINVVRKHLSRIKGGWLAKAIYPAEVLNLVISDVVGDDLSTIASGPLSPDKSTREDAVFILEKYGLEVPSCLENSSIETPKSDDKCFRKVKSVILANHQTAAKAVFDFLSGKNMRCEIVDTAFHGDIEEGVKVVLNSVREKEKIYIFSGELTVNVSGNGYGGRNQEFVLRVLREMRGLQRNYVVMALGTDGVDGFCPEDVAGAIAGHSILELKEDFDKYISGNDSYTFFKKAGGLIITGATGNNLGDIFLIVEI